MGSGQKAHFDDVGYSCFANIDPDHCNIEMKDKPLTAVANFGMSVGRGVVSGLQEALGDLELSASAAAVSTAIGVSLSALEAPLAVAAIAILSLIAGVIGTIQSLFMVAQSAGGIYSTAAGTGTFYDKVEAFAHDFTIMVVGIVTLTGSVKSVEASMSSFKSAAQELFGRKSRLTPSEVTKTYKGAKLITSFDDFLDYTKGFLDDDALQYAKEVLGNDADDVAKLKKVAQLIEDGSGKIGKKLSKNELKAGLDALWGDGGVEGALAAIERCCQKKIPIQTVSNKFPNDNQTGKIFHYTLENGNIKLENGIHEVDFIIDMEGNLRLGRGHSYLADGNSVQAAGKMKINSQGYVRSVDNFSGHYQPTVEQALNYPDILQKAGLNIDNTWIRINSFKASSSNYVIESEVFYKGPIKYMPK